MSAVASTNKRRKGKAKRIGGDERKATSKPSVALQQRAKQAARRAMDLATAGLPAFDELRTRTGGCFARVDKKLKNVPPDQRQPPPATIAAPAALQYALLGESEEVAELREMFENLLAASMDRRTANNVHPGFVAMISQMTPDEARILKSIDRDAYALVDLYDRRDEKGGGGGLHASRTLLGIGLGIDETRHDQYLSNLERLGILHTGDHIVSDVEEHNKLIAAVDAEFSSRHIYGRNRSIVVTALGRQFLDTCVRAHPGTRVDSLTERHARTRST